MWREGCYFFLTEWGLIMGRRKIREKIVLNKDKVMEKDIIGKNGVVKVINIPCGYKQPIVEYSSVFCIIVHYEKWDVGYIKRAPLDNIPTDYNDWSWCD